MVEDTKIRVVRVGCICASGVRTRDCWKHCTSCWQSLCRWQYTVKARSADWYVAYLARCCSILDCLGTVFVESEGRKVDKIVIC